MKVTSIEIHPENSSEIKVLSLRDPQRLNPYNVKGIVGLDADDIIPRYYGGSGDSKFYDMSISERELVIRIELNPRYELGETPSSLRDDMYKLISASRTGLLRILLKDGIEVKAALDGMFKKAEASLFSEKPEIQITLECEEPMLKALDRTIVDVSGLVTSLTNIQDLESTARHGFTFELDVTAAFDDLLITDPSDSRWSFEITPVGGFVTGDILYYSSEYNAKQLYITRPPDIIHLADVITPGSTWPILFPDSNMFTFSNSDKITWRSISYYETYWGV